MADQDVRVDQAAEGEDAPDGPGGSTGGSGGGTPDGPGTKDGTGRAPSDGSGAGGAPDGASGGSGGEAPPSGGADEGDPLGDPKDGPPTAVDEESLEGLTGAGGSGGGSGGGLFGDIGDAVADAYDDVEDSVNDAADDAGDAAGGAYDKVEGGAASLGHDIEHEVAKNWEDAGTWDRTAFGEHHGGFVDLWGTANAPFQAADRAYDAVEDDIAKAYEDSGLKDADDGLKDAYDDVAGGVAGAYRDAEDEVRDAYNDSALADHLAGYDVINAGELAVMYGPGVGAMYAAGKVAYNEGWDREAEDAANDAAGNAAEGDAGSADLDFGSGAPPVADDGLGRDDVHEPADPLAPVDDVEWDASQHVAEQAGEEDAQDATSQVGGLLEEGPPIDLPEPEALELG
jgi:hypothetical protein